MDAIDPTPEVQLERLLFHYTRSAENVVSILRNGFMVVPNPRGLMRHLLPNDNFKVREPQQFGMVSFTELRRVDACSHREKFGEFAIGVSWDWAKRMYAQRVLYVGEGRILEAFAWLFQYARQEVACNFSETPITAVLENRAIASAYSQAYAHLLTLYEFMEPDSNSGQVEWRIVNPIPEYHRLDDWEGMMAKLRGLASRGVGTIRLEPSDVEFLLCPKRSISSLLDALPPEFRSAPIVPTDGRRRVMSRLVQLQRSMQNSLRRRRHQRTIVAQELKSGPALALSPTLHDVYLVPELAKFGGLQVYPDAVADRASCSLQFDDPEGNTCQLDMSLVNAAKLAWYLNQALTDKRLHPVLRALVVQSRSQNQSSEGRN